MHTIEYQFSDKKVPVHFDAVFNEIYQLTAGAKLIILTDDQVFGLHAEKFSGYPVISFVAGEANKQQATVNNIIDELIKHEADRNTFLIAVGGGVVTDIGGYVAAIYMRGIRLALVPTSILAMVDATIGGKNGIDVGLLKNLVGTFRQPDFILYDYSFLSTLPFDQWVNGFAEIIKHACVRDAKLFAFLEQHNLHEFQNDHHLISELIEKNVNIKSSVVAADVYEKGERKILNFGHTIGHAIENTYHLSHGQAVSIGMVAACNLSEQIGELHFEEARRVVSLLAKYHLSVDIETDHEQVFEILKMDKKRSADTIDFILLSEIGRATIQSVPLDTLQKHIKEIM